MLTGLYTIGLRSFIAVSILAACAGHTFAQNEPRESPLFDALLLQDDDAIAEALSSPLLDPNLPGPDGTTPLNLAVEMGDLNAVRYLVLAGADPQIPSNGVTPYELAILIGEEQIAAMLEPEAPVDDKSGWLIAAINTGDDNTVRQLIEDGVDVLANDGRSPLVQAVALGQEEIAALLIEAGADVNAADAEGIVPLFAAISSGETALVQTLLDAGADPNAKVDGIPLLSTAVLVADDVAQILVDGGARIEATDADGVTPVELAAVLGKEKLLEAFGASIESAVKPAPVSLISSIVDDDQTAILNAMKRESINQLTEDGQPYLHLLITNTQNPWLLDKVIRAGGVDLSVRASDGSDLFDAILARGGDETALTMVRSLFGSDALSATERRKLFIQENAQRINGFNRILVGWSDQNTSLDIVRILDLGVIVSEKDGSGVAPMETAVLFHRNEALEKMLSVEPMQATYAPSLQDRARSVDNWKAFRSLPYDRTPPFGFEKGASKRIKMDMQERLRDWGYYTGPIDGVLGAGSRAALIQYYSDVEQELKRIVSPTKDLSTSDVDAGQTFFELTHRPPGSWCQWELVYWKPRSSGNRSVRFVGCVVGDNEWNANGSALVEFRESGVALKFLGSGGWDGDVDIR